MADSAKFGRRAARCVHTSHWAQQTQPINMSGLLFGGVQEGIDGEWETGAFPATPPAWPLPPSHTPPLRATTPPAWPTTPSHTPPLRAPTPQQLASPELSAQHALPPPTPFHLSHEVLPRTGACTGRAGAEKKTMGLDQATKRGRLLFCHMCVCVCSSPRSR